MADRAGPRPVEADPEPGAPVLCASCRKPTPYRPPWSPREQLCDECIEDIQGMKERGEWLR